MGESYHKFQPVLQSGGDVAKTDVEVVSNLVHIAFSPKQEKKHGQAYKTLLEAKIYLS